MRRLTALAWIVAGLLFSMQASAQTTTFNYTGSQQAYTVPNNVCLIAVDARGAAGAPVSTSYSAGGLGGRVQAVIPVTPGETLNISVGERPSSDIGGWNGGGNGGSLAGGGGGASDIRQGGSGLADRVMVAGGGAGGGYDDAHVYDCSGGAGGGTTGGHGLANSNTSFSYNGEGGSQTSGGAAGTGTSNGSPGTSGMGGNADPNYGGGGGGGYNGGGGGASNITVYGGGGGGGCSYAIPAAFNVTHTQGTQSGHGQVTLTPVTGIPTPAALDGDTIGCIGASATYTVAPVPEANAYNWSLPPGVTVNSGQGTNSIMVTYDTLTSGMIEVTAANACDTSLPVTLNLTVVDPTIDAGTDTTICTGDSIQIDATTPSQGTYRWTPPTGLSDTTIATPWAQPTTTTTYTLTTTYNETCADTDAVKITVLPLADAGPDARICTGDSARLQAGGGISYAWSPATGLNDVAIADPWASPSDTTTYTVTVTDSIGCTDTDSATVYVVNTLFADAGADTTICAGESVQLTASGGSAYAWSPAAGLSCTNCKAPVASPDSTTSYIVTVSSGICTPLTDTVTISVDSVPLPPVVLDDTACMHSSVTLVATASADIINWYDAPSGGNLLHTGDTFTTPPLTSSTTYYVAASNGGGNLPELMYFTFDEPAQSVTANHADPSTRVGPDATLVGSLTMGGTGQLGSALMGSGSSSTSNYADPGWATDLSGDWTLSLYLDDIPSSSTLFYYFGDNSASSFRCFTNGVAGANNLMLRGGGLNDVLASGGASTSGPTVTHFVHDASANETKAYVNGVLVATVSQGTINATGTQFKIGGYGGTAGLDGKMDEFRFYNRALNATEIAGTWNRSLLAGSACPSSRTPVTVTIPTPADAGRDATICTGANTQLSASGGVSYSWSPSTGLSDPTIADPWASPSDTTTYTVTVTDSNGCTSVDSVTIFVSGSLVADAGADTTICSGDSVSLMATGGTGFAWSPAAGLNCTNCQSPTASPDATTMYIVTVSSGSCTPVTDTVTVTVQLPSADAGADRSVCEGDSVQLNASGGESYAWSPATGLSDPTVASPWAASPANAITYTVTVTDSNGCTATDATTVTPLFHPEAGFSFDITDYTVNFTDTSAHTFNYAWDFGDDNTATDVDPNHTYEAPGDYEVCLTVSNACGSDTHCEMIVISSVPGLSAQPHVKVYPNPAGAYLTVEISGIAASEAFELHMYSMEGRQVNPPVEISREQQQVRAQVDVADLAEGFYLIRVVGDSYTLNEKVFVVE